MATKKRARPEPKKAKGQASTSVFERLTTGIPGLDVILNGGFLAGGTYLILGTPGTGKTIFANQLGFHDSDRGRKTLYVTLLAENHTRMFGHLESLSFFDRTQVAGPIHYVSGYNVLEKEGLDGLLKLLGALVQRHRANILFIDRIASAEELSGAPINFKKFVHNLNSVLSLSGCTSFLLSSIQGDASRPEYTMVDGIINLTFESIGMRSAREIQISKFRGSSHAYGRHFFQIDEHGITVFPRIESAVGLNRVPAPITGKRLKTGIASLDRLLNGGFARGSLTALTGAPGTGKTSIGMRFLEEGARNSEPSLFMNFYEPPQRLPLKPAGSGVEFSERAEEGCIQLLRRLPSEFILDKVIYELLAKIRDGKIQRLFIDGVGAMKEHGIVGAERLEEIMKALSAELRFLGVTTLFVEESDRDHPPEISYESAVTDNIIELCHVFLKQERVTTLNIVKCRNGAPDKNLYELELTEKGPKVSRPVRFLKTSLPVIEYAPEQKKS